MKTLQEYILAELHERATKDEFYIDVYSAAIQVLTPLVGAKMTKRECTKIEKLLLPKYPDIRSSVNDCMGKEFNFWCSNDNYSSRRELKLYSVGEYETAQFRQCKLDDYKKALENNEKDLKNTLQQISCLPDIVALMLKQKVERQDLERAQAREIEVFEKQCKVSLNGYDYVVKQAQEQQQKDSQDAYWNKQREEFEANRK